MRRNAGCASVKAKGFLVQKMALGQQGSCNASKYICRVQNGVGANDLFMYYGQTEQFQVTFDASIMNALLQFSSQSRDVMILLCMCISKGICTKTLMGTLAT